MPLNFALLETESIKRKDYLVKWRRLFHQHPEVGLDVPFARDVIITHLHEIGLARAYRSLKAGIIVELSGGNRDLSSTVAFRVDMDALPLKEKTNLPYASSMEGCMHGCGHDAHTAIGLGVIDVLHSLKDTWKGAVRVIFQSGEEVLQGAKLMLTEGALNNPGVVALLGCHIEPKIALGSVGLKSGQINAYTDEFHLFIKGKSTHGASPHLGCDPVVAASFAIQALQTIVSRSISPLESAVISIGEIKGGSVSNVIPDEVKVKGTIRSLNSKTRDLIFLRMSSILSGLETCFDVQTEIVFTANSPPVICDEKLTRRCFEMIKEVVGEEKVINLSVPQLGGDDFAFFAQKVPATMIRLGCGKENYTFPLHSSHFNFDEEVMVMGVALFSYLLTHLALPTT
ncbi:amidohydrolase [Candidatus Aerophobetes bacterium]|nr:amidohydrolase [Candidatus Aerophobetes bacterium]